MVIFFEDDNVALAEELGSYHKKKEKIKRIVRNYRTLKR